MFTWLKNKFSKNHPTGNGTSLTKFRRSGFQLADISDIQFVFDSIVLEASSGHFTSEYLYPIPQHGLQQQIRNSILQRRCPTHRGGESGAAIYVYVDNNRPVAFSWVVETDRSGELELYLLAVAPDSRKGGMGKTMVMETIAQFPLKTKFIARLYPASHVMLRMLVAIGFTRRPRQGRTTTHLSYVS